MFLRLRNQPSLLSNMGTQVGFVLKILLLSTGISLAIVYGGEYLPVKPTTTTALVMVLLPSLAMGSILGWRYNRKTK